MKMEKKKFCCCTNCFRNFTETIWQKNRGCLFCRWEKPELTFKGLGIVKTGDPFPCYIKNNGRLLINDKQVEFYK